MVATQLTHIREGRLALARPRLTKVSLKRHMAIFLPALLSVALFGATIFWLILPKTTQMFMAKKKEMIRELTVSAWSLLGSYERQVRENLLSRTEAEALALSRIRTMRYGYKGKNYFFVIDLHPFMLSHAYRTDLEGKDMSYFADPTGRRIFAEFVNICREHGEGFATYQWQWWEDTTHMESKLSFIKLFKPWGWIVGTGIYLDDVRREMEEMRGNLILMGGLVLLAVILVAGFITVRGVRLERERYRLEERLTQMATTDALTGVANYHHFWSKARKEFQRQQRYQNPLAVLLLDVDHFKKVNDTYGHPTGDRVLRALARACEQSLRRTDVFGRLGGEEFAAVLVETGPQEAREVAERLRQSLAQMEIPSERGKVRITVSVGVTSAKGSDPSMEAVMSRVDKCLYRAKNNGRNRVEQG